MRRGQGEYLAAVVAVLAMILVSTIALSWIAKLSEEGKESAKNVERSKETLVVTIVENYVVIRSLWNGYSKIIGFALVTNIDDNITLGNAVVNLDTASNKILNMSGVVFEVLAEHRQVDVPPYSTVVLPRNYTKVLNVLWDRILSLCVITMNAYMFCNISIPRIVENQTFILEPANPWLRIEPNHAVLALNLSIMSEITLVGDRVGSSSAYIEEAQSSGLPLIISKGPVDIMVETVNLTVWSVGAVAEAISGRSYDGKTFYRAVVYPSRVRWSANASLNCSVEFYVCDFSTYPPQCSWQTLSDGEQAWIWDHVKVCDFIYPLRYRYGELYIDKNETLYRVIAALWNNHAVAIACLDELCRDIVGYPATAWYENGNLVMDTTREMFSFLNASPASTSLENNLKILFVDLVKGVILGRASVTMLDLGNGTFATILYLYASNNALRVGTYRTYFGTSFQRDLLAMKSLANAIIDESTRDLYTEIVPRIALIAISSEGYVAYAIVDVYHLGIASLRRVAGYGYGVKAPVHVLADTNTTSETDVDTLVNDAVWDLKQNLPYSTNAGSTTLISNIVSAKSEICWPLPSVISLITSASLKIRVEQSSSQPPPPPSNNEPEPPSKPQSFLVCGVLKPSIAGGPTDVDVTALCYVPNGENLDRYKGRVVAVYTITYYDTERLAWLPEIVNGTKLLNVSRTIAGEALAAQWHLSSVFPRKLYVSIYDCTTVPSNKLEEVLSDPNMISDYCIAVVTAIVTNYSEDYWSNT